MIKLVSGLTYLPKISAKSDNLLLTTVNDTKDSSATKIINFQAEYMGLAASVLIDNQDTANPVTVRLNRNFHTLTLSSSSFRAFNDAWIEQVELSGASTDCQVTAQVTPLRNLIPGAP